MIKIHLNFHGQNNHSFPLCLDKTQTTKKAKRIFSSYFALRKQRERCINKDSLLIDQSSQSAGEKQTLEPELCLLYRKHIPKLSCKIQSFFKNHNKNQVHYKVPCPTSHKTRAKSMQGSQDHTKIKDNIMLMKKWTQLRQVVDFANY